MYRKYAAAGVGKPLRVRGSDFGTVGKNFDFAPCAIDNTAYLRVFSVADNDYLCVRRLRSDDSVYFRDIGAGRIDKFAISFPQRGIDRTDSPVGAYEYERILRERGYIRFAYKLHPAAL